MDTRFGLGLGDDDYVGCESGIGCISVDPELDENFMPIWCSTSISPCINTGDPDIWDADGTPSDIGAIYLPHDYHITKAIPNKVRYRSLPVLDRIYGDGFLTTYMFDAVPDQTGYFIIYDQDGNEKEWQDIIKIANGRWPTERNIEAEEKAKQIDKTIAESLTCDWI